jgi:hypothetical protein
VSTRFPPQRLPNDREHREITALSESIAERQRRNIAPGVLYCPLCIGRRRTFVAAAAMWMHVRDVHQPMEPYALAGGDIGPQMSERIEEGLIRIINSLSHEEAMAIATKLLLDDAEIR